MGSRWVVGGGYMSGTHLGTHCGGVRVRIGGESVNNVCDKVVVNWTVPLETES